MLAADVAELLAAGGVPFRSAHEAMGRLVQRAEAEGRHLSDFVGEKAADVDSSLASIRPEWWDVGAALERRSVTGGSSPGSVRNQIAEARNRLDG
jgi:argininosuccinate lyase